MRANGLKFLFAGLLALCLLSGGAFAQDSVTMLLYKADEGQLEPLFDAQVTWSLNGGPYDIAPNVGVNAYEFQAENAKIQVHVTHEALGSKTFNVDLPEGGVGNILMAFVNEETGQIKLRGMNAWLEPFEDFAQQGPNPATPPPGQGCQLPDQMGHGQAGYVALTSDRTSPFVVADCIKPLNDGFLTHAAWWGAYINVVFGLGTDCGPGPGDDFQITYYNDDNGHPGTVLAGPFSVGLSEKFQTGNQLQGFADEWQFQSTFHAPVAVTAGQCIWVEISNDTPGDPDCFWLWSTSPDGDGRACQTGFDGVTWEERDTDMAFCVNFQIQGTGCPPVVGPANDDCANCESISGEGDFNFDNTDATSTGPDHVLCDSFGTQAIDNDVWYCWTAPCDATAVLETCSLTSVDTKIAVYDSTDCGNLDANILDCNDDSCSLQSRVTWAATSGSTYLVRIGTFPGADGGTGQFNITCGAGAPANDDCANAESVAIGATVSGDTSTATLDANATDCGTTVTAPGVWYSVIGNGNELTASTCNQAAYDTKISVYCGTCGSVICVDGNDDGAGCSGFTSEISWCSAVGQEYLVLVHGFSSETGAFDLSILDGAACGSPPACSTPVQTHVDITSNVNGVFVDVTPIDLFGMSAGLTPFTRSYNPLTFVEVSAPLQWDARDLLGVIVNDRVLRPATGTYAGVLSEYRKLKLMYGDGETTQSGDVLFGR